MISAFADDTGFFVDGTISASNVLITFDKFGEASGSKVNREKTEGMWLGKFANRIDHPLNIKWVKNTKSLGIHIGYGDIQSLNWVRTIDNFKRDILKHLYRETTLLGKTKILNYIGYSKLWYKALHSTIPEYLCYRNNGNAVSISETIQKLSQGLLWGFQNKQNGMEIDYNHPKKPSISIQTLYLKQDKGGTNLIDFKKKMKAFRILFVFKYLNQEGKKWHNILKYWYAVNLHSISNQRWNNCYPHVQDTTNIPPFFRKCLEEFKDYYSRHGGDIHEKINTKKIYENLIEEMNHTPAAIIKYSDMAQYLRKLPTYKFLDPYLRFFLFKLYHCKLYFKRYKLNINDLLNFGQKCILCYNAIDTPSHLFEKCAMGKKLRDKRDHILNKLNYINSNSNENEKVYACCDNTSNIDETQRYIIVASNYSIYSIKMKKWFDNEYIVSNNDAMFNFIHRIKVRIFCDHRNYSLRKFQEIWDPNNSQCLFNFNESRIFSWKLQ